MAEQQESAQEPPLVSEPHEPIHGHCLCEAIRYTITFPTPQSWPPNRYNCHCPQCRHQTGALLVNQVEVPLSDLTITDPSSHLREFSSSPDVRRGFCGNCGSVMYFKRLGCGKVDMHIGTLDSEILRKEGEILAVPATGQLWCTEMIKGVSDWKIEGGGTRWIKDVGGEAM